MTLCRLQTSGAVAPWAPWAALALLILLSPPRVGEAATVSMASAMNYAGAYPGGCNPNVVATSTPTTPALAYGDSAYVCLNINGKMTSIYNVVVDQYTAVTAIGSASASGGGGRRSGSGGRSGCVRCVTYGAP